MSQQEFHMNAGEYEAMYRVEKDHWWYLGLRDLLFGWTRRLSRQWNRNDLTILDAGCGTGINFIEHEKMGCTMWGVDASWDAIAFMRKRGARNIQQALIQSLPYPDGYFDVIYSMDVIVMLREREVKQAFVEMKRCLKPEGRLLLNFATLQFLYSSHDVASQVVARHSKSTIERLLRESGFVLEKSTYRLFLLFPLLAAAKLTQKIGLKGKRAEQVKGDLEKTNALMNVLMSPVMRFENLLLRILNLPIGTSLFMVARTGN
jgi:ubiquinone/menaquinone biosynthesis C-methylase UbiE